MTRQDELYEKYEEALFAILMDKVAECEGEKYLEESEKLNSDPYAKISEALDKRCRRTIKRAFLKNKLRDPLRIIRIVVKKAAVIVVVLMLLFTSAYALVPEVRIRTLNMLINKSDVATSLTFALGENSDIGDEQYIEFSGYSIPVAPDGFVITDHGNNSNSVWVSYENSKGAMMYYSIGGNYESVLNVDTEDADSVQQIMIHGFDGLIIEKGTRIHIVWGDTVQEVFVNIVCVNIDKDIIIDIANNMRK